MQSKDPNNTIGKEIKKLRQKLNFTQYLVAEKLGISLPAFSKIETGITDLNMSRLNQIAALFNVPVGNLVNGIEETTPSNNFRPQTEELEIKIAARDLEIIELQKKLIDLYEEVRG